MSDKTGGPAFLREVDLRDYFAAQMMTRELGVEVRPHRDYNYRNAAIRAYRMADAMLAQREKQE